VSESATKTARKRKWDKWNSSGSRINQAGRGRGNKGTREEGLELGIRWSLLLWTRVEGKGDQWVG